MNIVTQKAQVAGIDPLTVIIVIKAVIELIQLARECKKSDEDIAAIARNPGPVQRVLIRRVIARHVKDRGERAKVYDAVLKLTAELTAAEYAQAVVEAG